MASLTDQTFTDKIVSLYLWGLENSPEKIASDEYIRPLANPYLSVPITVADYMGGPGRFMKAAYFEIVQKFFNHNLDVSVEGLTQGVDYTLEGDKIVYSKAQILERLGVENASYSFNQAFFDDGSGDYYNRVFIWGSTAFSLADDVRFVIDEHGDRIIENLSIIPRAVIDPNTKEDFDFSGGDFSNIFAPFILPIFDPFSIGRTVAFQFTNPEAVPSINYGYASFTADQSSDDHTIGLTDPSSGTSEGTHSYASDRAAAIARFALFGQDYIQGFYERDVIKYVEDGKFVYFGTDNDDSIVAPGRGDEPHQTIHETGAKGSIIVTGDGRDTAEGGDFDDTFIISHGQKTIDGGWGTDTVRYVGGGDDPVSLDVRGGGGLLGQSVVVSVTHGGVRDDLTSIERVIGSDYADVINIHSLDFFGADVEIDLGSTSKQPDIADTINLNDYVGAELVTVDLRSPLQIVRNYAGESINFRGVEAVIGSNNGDTIYGSNSGDDLRGGLGSDTIHGGSGNDRIYGANAGIEDGIGDDLYGGGGANLFYIGTNDVIHDLTSSDRVEWVKAGASARTFSLAPPVGSAAEGSSHLIIGGERTAPPDDPCRPAASPREEDGLVYEGADGSKYTWSGGALTINYDGGSASILNFRNGAGGIVLREERPDQQQAECTRDPLIIDLDGDRNVVRELYDSTAYFDLDNDGFRERVAWSLSGDGFLVRDLNGNGQIDNGSELFGTGSVDSLGGRSRLDDGGRSGTDGFVELGQLDSNRDGIISALDTDFATLRVWVDANGDAITDAGELKTLEELGLVSISLSTRQSDDLDCGCDGTEVTYMSSITRSDGALVQMYDAWLSIDQYDTRENVTDVTISADISALPFLIGSGTLSDLDVAMARDPALAEMVRAFANLDASQVGEITERVEQILLRWTGADTVAPDSRGVNMNAQWLAAIEQISGSEFVQSRVGPNPRADAAAILIPEWQDILTRTAAQLLGQTSLGATLTPGLSYAGAAFFSAEDGASLSGVMTSIAAQAPADARDALTYWHTMLGLVSHYKSALGVTDAQIDSAASSYLAISGLGYTTAQIRAAIIVTDASQIAIGRINPDIIIAGDGVHDLAGGGGNDTYVVSRQAGDIHVDDIDGQNTVHLVDVDRAEVVVDYDFVDGRGIITLHTLDGGFSLDFSLRVFQSQAHFGVEIIKFADGSSASIAELMTDDEIVAPDGTGGTIILGRAGDGISFSDHSTDDQLIGSGKADTYHFGPNSGNDTVLDRSINGAGIDTLVIAADRADVSFALVEGSSGDVLVRIAGSEAMLVIKGQRLGNGTQIEAFTFADGATMTFGDLDQLLNTGTGDNDTIIGASYADTIEGGAGNDVLRGDGGADVYTFDPGFGRDLIIDPTADNAIMFRAGITRDMLQFERTGLSGGDLLIRVANTDDQIIVAGGLQHSVVTELRLSDSAIVPLSEILAEIQANYDSAVITGTEYDDLLTGSLLNDVFKGLGGNDEIDGFGGNDTFYLSEGQDSINVGSGNARFIAPEGVTAQDFRIINGNNWITFNGSSGNTFIYYSDGATFSIEFDDGTILNLSDLAQTTGTDGDDVLFHRGYQASATFNGGAGNDLLIGASSETAPDTYTFEAGFGQDVIYDNGGRQDAILFSGAGVAFEDASLSREGSNLVIAFTSGDRLTVEGYFWNFPYYDGDSQYWGQYAGVVENITFYNETSSTYLSATDVVGLISSQTDGDDWVMTGVRDGGAGNDILVGGGLANSYVFAAGYGHDVIKDGYYDRNGSYYQDTVIFTGLSSDDVTISRDPSDPLSIVFTIKATGETLTIDGTPDDGHNAVIGMNSSEGPGGITIEHFQFTDVTLSLEDVANRVLAAQASDGDDVIYGINSYGRIDGGAGDDTIILPAGSETIVITPNSGHDILTIEEVARYGFTIEFQGMEPGDVVLLPVSEVNGIKGNHLRIETRSGASLTILNGADEQLQTPSELGRGPAFEIRIPGADFYASYSGGYGPLGEPLQTGTAGVDYLSANFWDSESATFDPQGGNDLIFSAGGVDTVLFGRGYGEDRHYAAPAQTGGLPPQNGFADANGDALVVEMLDGLGPDDVSISWLADQVGLAELRINDTGDRLIFDAALLQEIRFADGQTIIRDGDTFLLDGLGQQVVLPTPTVEYGDDIVVDAGEEASGTALDEGFVLTGGNATFHFGTGSGFDYAWDEAIDALLYNDEALPVDWQSSTLVLDDVDDISELLLVRSGDDLEIYIPSTGDKLALASQFGVASGIVGTFILSNGTQLAWNDVLTSISIVRDSTQYDEPVIAQSNETITAPPGFVSLVANGSNVTFDIPSATGVQFIGFTVGITQDGEPSDPDWLPSNIVLHHEMSAYHFRRAGDDLIIRDTTTGNETYISGQFAMNGGVIANFTFADAADPSGSITYDWSYFDGDNIILSLPSTPTYFSTLEQIATAGIDRLQLSVGDEIDSLAGDDAIISLEGGSTLIFGAGDGNDHFSSATIRTGSIYDESYVGDTVRLEGIASLDGLRFLRGGDNLVDLVVEIRATGERLTIAEQFGLAESPLPSATSVHYLPIVTSFVLDGDTMIDWGTVAKRIEGTDLGGGNRIVTGTQGGVLDGGAGADSLEGGTGDDIYVFDRAYGEDVIRDAGGSDRVRFGTDITLADVYFSRAGENGADLLVEVMGADRLALTIAGQFSSSGSRVESFEFGDGQLLSWQDVQRIILSNISTGGDDVIVAFATNDQITAKAGNDQITGGAGDDVIDGGAGRDVAIFAGVASDYEVTILDGVTTVRDLIAGRDGTDTLRNIEDLRFLGDTASVPVTPPNSAPVAGPLAASAIEDQVLVITRATLLGLASDTDGDSLNLTAVVNGTHGQAWIDLDGNIRFRPAADYAGEAWFDYVVKDGNGGQASGRVTVTVSPVNDAPVVAVALATQIVDEDMPVSIAIPATAFADVDGDVLTLSATLADGTPLPAWLSLVDGVLAGQPPANFNGTLSIAVAALDVSLAATTTFDLVITPRNDAPTVITPLPDVTIVPGAILSILIPSAMFSDADGDTLVVSVSGVEGTSLPAWLSVDGQYLSGTVPADFTGSLDIQVAANDGRARAIDLFALSVSGNSAPIVANPLLDVSTLEDGAIDFSIPADTFSDADGDTLVLTASLGDGSALPAWLSFDGGRFTGTPPANFSGSLALRVQASDGSQHVASSFDLVIAPVNDAPTATIDPQDRISLLEGAPVSQLVRVVGQDVDGDALGYAIQSGNAVGLFSINEQGFLSSTRTAVQTDVGIHTLEILVSDGHGGTVLQTVEVEIVDINNEPGTSTPEISVSATEDLPFSYIVPADLFTDPDGDPLTITTSALPDWLSYADGVFSGTPDQSAVNDGSVVITLSATDGHGGAPATAQLTIMPTNVNDAPVLAEALADHTIGGGAAVNFTLPSSAFTDEDGDSLSYAVALADGSALPGWLSFNAGTRTFTGTAPANAATLDIRVTASDGSLTASDDFSLTIEQGTSGGGSTAGFGFANLNSWYNPSWGGGYIVTYNYTVQADAIVDGHLKAWDIVSGYDGPGTVVGGWLNGFNGGASFTIAQDGAVFSTVGQGYQPDLTVGTTFQLSLQINGAGYEADDFDFTIFDRDAPPNLADAGDTDIEVGATNDWGGGLSQSVTVNNIGFAKIDDWSLILDTPNGVDLDLTSVWGATATELANGDIRFEALDWNATIAVDGETSFGFNANYSGVSSLHLNEEQFAIA